MCLYMVSLCLFCLELNFLNLWVNSLHQIRKFFSYWCIFRYFLCIPSFCDSQLHTSLAHIDPKDIFFSQSLFLCLILNSLYCYVGSMVFSAMFNAIQLFCNIASRCSIWFLYIFPFLTSSVRVFPYVFEHMKHIYNCFNIPMYVFHHVCHFWVFLFIDFPSLWITFSYV